MKRVYCTFAVMAILVLYAHGQAAAAQSSDQVALLKQYVQNQYPPRADYVRCIFNDDEALDMRSRALPNKNPILDAAGAQAFVTLAQNDILALFGVQPTALAGATEAEKKAAAAKPKALLDPSTYKTMSDGLTSQEKEIENLTIYKAINTFANAAKTAKLSSELESLSRRTM